MKRKLYREGSLTLAKLLDIVSTYHHKEAIILAGEEKVNRTSENRGKASSSQRYSGKQRVLGKCRRCDKPGHMGKECEVSRNHVDRKCGKQWHKEVCCHTKQEKQSTGRSERRNLDRPAGKRQRVRNISDQPPHNGDDDNGYYVFSATHGYSNTLSIIIEAQPVSVIIDSGATCNIIPEEIFNLVSNG